jgi:hypothetical protein
MRIAWRSRGTGDGRPPDDLLRRDVRPAITLGEMTPYEPDNFFHHGESIALMAEHFCHYRVPRR